MNKIARPASREKLRERAYTVRTITKIPDDEPFPVVHFLESILTKWDYEMQIIPDEEMEDNYAETIPSSKTFRIRESVYENAINGSPWDRFTVAHEIGHLLLHDDLTVSFARSEKNVPAYKNPEWQANTFAAELLVPFIKIQGMTAEEISEKYQVSKKVAQIQASYLSKIPA